MRRFVALLTAGVLVASLGASSVSAAPPLPPKVNSFVGSFGLAEEGTWHNWGLVVASLNMPTDSRLVPGTYNLYGSRDNTIREDHAVIGDAQFWYDANNQPGGSNVAFGQGTHCIYYGPNNTTCDPFAVMFIDNRDPKLPDQVAFANHKDANDQWAFDYWYWVGPGLFKLTYVADSW
jgi:hypothetical protein